jgi:hypothetical protein
VQIGTDEVRRKHNTINYYMLMPMNPSFKPQQLLFSAHRGLIGLFIETVMGTGEFIPPSWFRVAVLEGKDQDTSSNSLFLGPVRVGAQQCGPLLDFLVQVVKKASFTGKKEVFSPVYEGEKQSLVIRDVEIAAVLEKEFLTRMLREVKFAKFLPMFQTLSGCKLDSFGNISHPLFMGEQRKYKSYLCSSIGRIE